MSAEKPTLARLLDWIEGRLPAPEAAAVASYVAAGDAETLDTVAWIRSFVRQSGYSALQNPPGAARAAVLAQFEAYATRQQKPTIFQRLIATLSTAGQAGPAVAGARGASISRRQLLYYTDMADVILNVRPRPQDSQYDLNGQVMPTSSALSATGMTVQMLRQDAEYGITNSNDLGEFAFEAVPPGVYEIILSGNQYEIEIAPIELQANA